MPSLEQWSTMDNILILKVIRKDNNNCKLNITEYGDCFGEAFWKGDTLDK